MKKTSIASLQERLADWTDWDLAMYHLGACLGFWPEFGAPHDNDQWHGVKSIMWSSNYLGDAMYVFMTHLAKEGCLEVTSEPDIKFRWNPEYKGEADLISML